MKLKFHDVGLKVCVMILEVCVMKFKFHDAECGARRAKWQAYDEKFRRTGTILAGRRSFQQTRRMNRYEPNSPIENVTKSEQARYIEVTP